MIDQPDDPIIDACLDEVLGGQTSPNLTARILNALKNTPLVTSSGSTEATNDEVVSVAGTRSRSSQSTTPHKTVAFPWLAIAATIAIVGVGGALLRLVWDRDDLQGDNANQIASPQADPMPSHPAPVPTPERTPGEPEDAPVAPPLRPLPIEDRAIAKVPESIESPVVSTQEVEIPDERPARLTEEQIVHAINELIRNRWQSAGTTPAEPVSDQQWCERLYLKLVGRQPSPTELESFAESRASNKRGELVELLLHGDTYIEEFASHWSRMWADILVASADKKANRDGLEQYLRRAFGEGKPFDETTTELLTATGRGKLGTDDYNGATNFLLAFADRKSVHTQLTAHTSRTFMALSLECTQCHDDQVWSGFEQQTFWELNAFFRQLRVSGGRQEQRVVDVDFAGEGVTPDSAEIYYYLQNGLLKTAYPVFVDDTEIPQSGKITDVHRRELLSKFVTRSERFRQAMANRFWAELFGVGFTIPADNIGPHNPPSHPVLLAKLGDQFAAHDYDVRSLIRWIVLSEPFALSAGDIAAHDQIAAKITFDRFPEARDRRWPLMKRLQVARDAYAELKKGLVNGARSANVGVTPDPGAVPKQLADVDDKLAAVHVDARRLSKATVYGNNILESDLSLEQKIQHIFFATLHRAPTANEQKSVLDVLANSASNSDESALEYIWWALASSLEAR